MSVSAPGRISAPLGRSARLVRALLLLLLVPATLLAWTMHVPARLAALLPTSSPPDHPTATDCAPYRSPDRAPVTGYQQDGARLRVFAIGYHLDLDHAASYHTWRTAMRCLMEETVVPHLKPGLPTLVVFPEDIGLPTLGIGARGVASPPRCRPSGTATRSGSGRPASNRARTSAPATRPARTRSVSM